jgi:hypothetical protein
MELAKQLLTVLGNYTPPLWATIIAGVFVIISFSLSLYLLFNHLSAYKNPEVVNCYQCRLLFKILNQCGKLFELCLTHSCHICLLSGTEVSCRRHSHGAMLCSRVGKVLCCCFVIHPRLIPVFTVEV